MIYVSHFNLNISFLVPAARAPVVQKPIEPAVTDEKPSADDVNAEEIRDDLSEISDEADDILNCQEVS